LCFCVALSKVSVLSAAWILLEAWAHVLYNNKGSDVFLRFGIGRFTTEEEVDYTADKCIHHVRRLREMR